MTIQFIIYDMGNRIITALPALPDNADYGVERGDVWFGGRKILGGVNWDNCSAHTFENPAEIGEFRADKYIFDPETETIAPNPDYHEEA